MSDETIKNVNKEIFDELLRTKIDLLESLQRIHQGLNLHPEKSCTESKLRLAVGFSKTNNGRKPYVVQMVGALNLTQKLSPIRTAILLVLFMDLEDRYDGGEGLADPIQAILDAYLRLEPELSDGESALRNVRVALYRFDKYCRDERAFFSEYCSMVFEAEQCCLKLYDPNEKEFVESISIELSTDDRVVTEILARNTEASPLAQVRKRGACYVPAGPQTYDRMLLELFDHRFSIEVTTLSTRLSTVSYPLPLLQEIGASELVIRRKQLADEAFREGRFRYLEIINKSTLQNLTHRLPDGTFESYPTNIAVEQVRDHLNYLIGKLEQEQEHELVITDLAFPFLIGAYQLHSSAIPEEFTVFFSNFSKSYLHDSTCFVIHNPMLNQSISQSIVAWILSHPTTLRVRSEVIDYIKVLQEQLEEGALETSA